MKFLNPKSYRAFYAGLEVHYEGYRFVFTVAEFLQLAMDQVGYYKEAYETVRARADTPEKIILADRFEFITTNLGVVDIVPQGNIGEWLLIAERLKQTAFDGGIRSEYGFKIAGRRIVIFSPSDRYAHDYGSENRYAVDVEKGEVDPREVVASPSGYAYLCYDKLKASDRLSKEGASQRFSNLGYRTLCLLLLKANLWDDQLTTAIRHALMGLQPARKEAFDGIHRDVKDSVNKFASARSMFERGEITEKEFKKILGELSKFKMSLSNYQERVSAPLTHAMTYRLAFTGLDGALDKEATLADCISVLVAAWFLSEFSRNRSAFLVGKMLLDLIDNRAKMKCDNLQVNWRIVLTHPDLPLEGALNKIDPDRSLSRIGGLHPMAHMESFSDGFSEGPFHLNPRYLEWSHVKSGAIMCEWLVRYLLKQKINSKILNQTESLNYKKLPAALNTKIGTALKEELIEPLTDCWGHPNSRHWRFRGDEEEVSVEQAFHYSGKYKLKRDELWVLIRQGFSNLCTKPDHPCFLDLGKEPAKLVNYVPVTGPDGRKLAVVLDDKTPKKLEFKLSVIKAGLFSRAAPSVSAEAPAMEPHLALDQLFVYLDREFGLEREKIAGDGNCQFTAIASQLRAVNLERFRQLVEEAGFCLSDLSPDRQLIVVRRALRIRVVFYMSDHREEFEEFFAGGNFSFDAYLERTSHDGPDSWGDNLTLRALRGVLKDFNIVTLRVGMQEGAFTTEHIHFVQNPAENIDMHRTLVIVYNGATHYDTIRNRPDDRLAGYLNGMLHPSPPAPAP